MESWLGSFGFHLVVFSGFAILLGAALSRRGATSDRWTVAASLVLALQALSVASASLAIGTPLSAPLGRLLSVAAPAVVTWAALGPAAGRAVDRALAATLGLCALVFAASLLAGTTGPFNRSPLDQAWSLLGLLVAASSSIALVVRRPSGWIAFAAGAGILLAGFVVHIGVPPTTAETAPALSISLAIASPAITLGAVLVLLGESRPTAAPADRPSAMRVDSAIQAAVLMSEATDAATYAAALTQAVGTWLRAEYCLLLAPPGSPGGFSIGAGYDLLGDEALYAIPLNPERFPVLTQALDLGRSVRLPASTHAPDAAMLLETLGHPGPSPGLLVPFVAEGRTVAGLLLLSPREQREWDEETRIALERLAPSLAGRLERLRGGAADSPPGGTARADLEQAQRRIADLEAERRVAPDEERGWLGVEEVQVELERAHQTIDLMQAELDRLRDAVARGDHAAPAETQAIQSELALALSALAEVRGEAGGAAPPTAPSSAEGSLTSLEEIRQPLTAIAGYTDLLLGESIGLLGATQRKFLQRIRTAVLRMEESLASMAERDRRAPPPDEVADLGTCVEQALGVIQEDLRARRLSVRLDVTQAAARVAGRPSDVRRIVSDLLSNAAAASPPGREIHVSLHTDPVERVAILAISDRGRGVPADDLHRVFTAKRWREAVVGLGLDSRRLAAVKALAEALGGRVWVESDPAEGTTFFILLPVVETG